MFEHNALGYWSGLALCLTKVRSSRARCSATALILSSILDSFSSFVHAWKDLLHAELNIHVPESSRNICICRKNV